MASELRPGRTVAATVLGGIAGMVGGIAVGDLVIEPMMDVQGLATLLPVLWSAIVGIVLGSGIALVVAFRDEPAVARAVTAGTVVAVGLALFVVALTDVADVMVAHPVTMAVGLPVVALLARLVAVRTGGRSSMSGHCAGSRSAARPCGRCRPRSIAAPGSAPLAPKPTRIGSPTPS